MVCYVKHSGYVAKDTSNYACSGDGKYKQCCNSGDFCGADGFCHFTHYQEGDITGYYMGGCTDPTFTDKVCPQQCTEYPTQDVIYNSTNSLWACCYGDGSLDCLHPGNETFYAPPVQKLFASASASSISASSTPITSTNSPTSTHSGKSSQSSSISSPPQSQNTGTSSSSLSTGAEAGIVIGALVIAACAGTLVALWNNRRKAKKRGRGQADNAVGGEEMRQPHTSQGSHGIPPQYRAEPKYGTTELGRPGREPIYEAPNTVELRELEANPASKGVSRLP